MLQRNPARGGDEQRQSNNRNKTKKKHLELQMSSGGVLVANSFCLGSLYEHCSNFYLDE